MFEFLRNDNWYANNFFTNAAGQPRGPFHQNSSGRRWRPIVHNRRFFFGDYQGTRRASKTGSSISDVTPGSIACGRFFQVGTVIYDPASRRIGPTAGHRRSPSRQPHPENRMNASSVASKVWVRCLILERRARSRGISSTRPPVLKHGPGDIRVDQSISASDNLSHDSPFQQSTPGWESYPGFIGGVRTQS